MRTAAKLLWLVGLAIGFIGLILEKEETYQ